jgi:cytochrome c peroxidase
MRRTLFTISAFVFFLTGLSYLLGGCNKDQNTKGITLIKQEIPAGFPTPAYTFFDNPLSAEGIELGRKLFYDGRLSIDNMHPCSSCHQQIAGFGTFEHDRSHGVNNSHTLRNAPVLFNLAWSTSLHWDGAYNKLTDAIAQPLHGTTEMGETYAGIINKLQKDEGYSEQFKTVFRSNIIRPEYILKALAQFTGYLISANAKYDKVQRGQATFTAIEQSGYNLFQQKCATCHPAPLFTDYSYRNIGLPVDPFLNDYGRLRATGNNTDSLKFKVPTLRNALISSNYMHDGRFGTLQQCINHYRTGVRQSVSVDPLVRTGISMTDSEAENLYQFLKTLTDSSFITNPALARPQ